MKSFVRVGGARRIVFTSLVCWRGNQRSSAGFNFESIEDIWWQFDVGAVAVEFEDAVLRLAGHGQDKKEVQKEKRTEKKRTGPRRVHDRC